jgi:GTPase SAR1 family protein
MATDPATAVAMKIGMDVLTRVTPRGLAWVKSKWVGRDLLVVGQPRAGKTSLVRYVQHGVFAETETKRTRAIKTTASFNVKVGRDESLALEVRKAIDTVGQVSASVHADITKDYKPHVVLVVIDMSGPWDGKDDHNAKHYLDEYFDYLAAHYRKSYWLRRKLKAVYIIANKKDKMTLRAAATFMRKADIFVKQKARAVFDVDSIDTYVLESSLVEDFDGGKSANNIIQKVALKLNEG